MTRRPAVKSFFKKTEPTMDNQSFSVEEADRVAALVESLVGGDASWVFQYGTSGRSRRTMCW